MAATTRKKSAKKDTFSPEIENLGWAIGRDLGEGAFGKVKLVTRKEDGITAACKIIAKPKDLKKMKVIQMEYKIMKEMDHPYIVKCFDAVETDNNVFLFLELMEGGELFDKIVDMGHFTESMAGTVTYNFLSALNYMHSKGIIHRDLKPENMLLAKDGDFTAVKLTDFGLSKMLDAESALMKTPVGTPGYVAPEVLLHLEGGYDKQVDVWSLGVIVYILLCGFPPFYADNDAQLFAKIKAGNYKFLAPFWDPISTAAKDFIRRMIVVDPKKRATTDELMLDPWLAAAASHAAPPAEEKELISTDYQLKETEEKLARQTKMLQNALATLRAKNRFLQLIGRSPAQSFENSTQSAATEEATTEAASAQDAAMVDVKISSDADEGVAKGGCKCIIS
mmetsp:Transcript_6573/g.17029  ORF Transcript_6573/g.17029 Transcript_6573/m.17029 type:complete len:393 (+) Transcript_6573:74-1252(+)